MHNVGSDLLRRGRRKDEAYYVNEYMERSMDCLCADLSELLDEESAKKIKEYFDQLKVKNENT